MKRGEVYLVNFGKKYNSEVCINEICTLDMSRIAIDDRLTILTDEEMGEVEHKMLWHLNLV